MNALEKLHDAVQGTRKGCACRRMTHSTINEKVSGHACSQREVTRCGQSTRKGCLESSGDAHTDKLLQLRMSNLHIFITTHYPESHVRKEMLGLVHKLQALSHKALEHKE